MKTIAATILTLIACGLHAAGAEGGYPLGGVGTGAASLAPDGRLDSITVNQNFGAPIQTPAGTFAALAVNRGGSITARELARAAGGRGASETRFVREIPEAMLEFSGPDMPAEVRLHAFSPLIPGDLERSSLPGAVFRYRVRNPSAQSAMVSVAFSWQNLAGHGAPAGGLNGGWVHESFLESGAAGVRTLLETADGSPAPREYTVLAQAPGDGAVSFLPAWTPESGAFWPAFEAAGTLPETEPRAARLAAGPGEAPAGAVCVQLPVAPGGEREFVFVLAWNAPRLAVSDGGPLEARYAERWRDSRQTASHLLDRWPSYLEAMNAYWNRLAEADIPLRVLRGMRAELSLLQSHGIHLRDGRFGLATLDPRRPGNIGSPEERLAMADMLLACFPDLLRSELDLFAGCQLADGAVPSAAGHVGIRIGTGDVPGGFLNRPDSAAAFIALIHLYTLWTGDEEFGQAMAPHIRMGAEWLMAQDRNGDGLPDGPSVWDDNAAQVNAFGATLYLAALKIAAETNGDAGDFEFQARTVQRLREGAESASLQLWNGHWLRPSFAPGESAPGASRGGAGMPIGEWLCARNGWNPLLGADKVLSTLKRMDRGPQGGGNGGSPINLDFLNRALRIRAGFGLPTPETETEPGDGRASGAPALGAWSLYREILGAAVDMTRRCVIAGPEPPDGGNEFSAPFDTPGFGGEIEYLRSDATGLIECRIANRGGRTRAAELEQVAFKPRLDQDPNRFLLKVIHGGAELAGQDFTRERLRVFAPAKPIRLQDGESLTLLAIPRGTGTLRVNLDEGTVANLGTHCTVEILRAAGTEISFRAVNLEREYQAVFVDAAGGEAGDSAVYLNGEPLGMAAAGLDAIPITLPPGPVPAGEYAWLRLMLAGCAEAALNLDENASPRLKNRLWDLQTVIEEAIEADASARGHQIDIVPSQSQPPSAPSRSRDADEARRAVARARSAVNSMLNDLPSLTRDPVIAARFAGHFAPARLDVRLEDRRDWTGGPIPLRVTVENPAKIPMRARVTLETPEGWTAETADPVAFEDAGPETAGAHTVRFTVRPGGARPEGRVPLTAYVSGVFGDVIFRKQASVAVGHEFLTEWLLIGPFPNERGEGFERNDPPEINIKPEETYEAFGKTIGWRKMEFPNGWIDMNRAFSPNDNAVGYAYVGVYSPHERNVWFEVGADEGMKVFHNYREIFAKSRFASARPGTERIPATLYEGWNHIVAKVPESEGEWGFYFEITGPGGRSLPDLRFAHGGAE